MRRVGIARPVALAVLLSSTGAVLGASDGNLDSTSTGTMDVSVQVPDRVQISKLTDIDFGTYSGSGDLSDVDAYCVYRNGSGLYDLTTSSANEDAGNFRVTDGTNFITYSVKVDDDTDPSDGTAVDSSQTLTGLQGSGTSTTCGGSTNGGIQVTFAESDLQAAFTSTYTDTITLLVAPN